MLLRVKNFNLKRIKPSVLVASVLALFFLLGTIAWAQLLMGPALTGPPNGSNELSNPPNLGWCAIDANGNSFAPCSAANGMNTNPGFSYNIHLCDATASPGCTPAPFDNVLPLDVCNPATNSCRYTPPPLLPGTTYRWQIVAEEGATFRGSEIRSFTVTVTPPPSITVTANPISRSIAQNDTTNYLITAAGADGVVPGPVNFSQVGCPPGATCTFTPVASCIFVANNDTCSVTLQISNTLTVPAGNYIITIAADHPGQALSDSTNVTLNVTALADLTIAESGSWPTNVNNGDSVVFNFITFNVGGTDANNFSDGLFIGGVEISRLGGRSAFAGTSNPGTFNWTATGCGLQNIEVHTDIDDVIFEGVETNNTNPVPAHVIDVFCPLPDYTISQLTSDAAATICVGDNVNIDTTIINSGPGDASFTSIGALYDNGVEFCQNTTPGLSSGSTDPYSCVWSPSSSGSHTIESRADIDGAIVESDETNNTLSLVQTVTAVPIQTPAPTFSAIAHDTLTVNWVDVAGETYYQVWRNTTNNFASAVNVSGNLAANTTSWVDNNVSPVTTYYYWVVVGNTCGSATSPVGTVTTLATPMPDLTVVQATVWPTTVTDGGLVNLVYTVSNIGTATAVGYIDEMYIDGVAVYTQGPTNLDPGIQSTIGYTWTATGCGSNHTVEVVTDRDGVVVESDENNNTTGVYDIFVNCILEPDLIITPLAGWPTSVDEGQVVNNLTFTTSNIGTANAFNFTDALYVDGVLVNSVSGRSVGAGGNNTYGFNWLATGCGSSHSVTLETDIANVVNESDESNNTSPPPAHMITVNCLPVVQLIGDLNCDNRVGIEDLGILLSTTWWGDYSGGYSHPNCGGGGGGIPPPPAN